MPVANPVITSVSASATGISSNFVADPFLYIQGDVFYVFFETKNSITMQGDIGVARSTDKGASWEQLGIALVEDWHLSYLYVFEYNGNIYMLPESRAKGQLGLYRAVNFPQEWTLEKIISWLFGSDRSGIGAEFNAKLEIWYSSSPLGPWKPHKKNPIYKTHKNMGARNG
ncbi:Glycosyltransferase family protein 64 protein C5, partial [Capsicum chinense]